MHIDVCESQFIFIKKKLVTVPLYVPASSNDGGVDSSICWHPLCYQMLVASMGAFTSTPCIVQLWRSQCKHPPVSLMSSDAEGIDGTIHKHPPLPQTLMALTRDFWGPPCHLMLIV